MQLTPKQQAAFAALHAANAALATNDLSAEAHAQAVVRRELAGNTVLALMRQHPGPQNFTERRAARAAFKQTLAAFNSHS